MSKQVRWPPKNADMVRGSNYYKKVSHCNLAQPYSKTTGRLLQRFEIINDEFELINNSAKEDE